MQSQITGVTAKGIYPNAEKWPCYTASGSVPSIGPRTQILGGEQTFPAANVAYGAYENDSMWRFSPLSFCLHAVRWAPSAASVSLAMSRLRTLLDVPDRIDYKNLRRGIWKFG